VQLFENEVLGVAIALDQDHRNKFVFSLGYTMQEGTSSTNFTKQYLIKISSWRDLGSPIKTIPIHQFCSEEVTCFAVSELGNHLSIGFSSGTILLFSQDFLGNKNINRGLSRPQFLVANHSCPVSSLSFSLDPNPHIFACYHDSDGGEEEKKEGDSSNSTLPFSGGIASFPIHSPSSPLIVLEEKGVGPNLCSYSSFLNELVVGRGEGVFFYGPEERGGTSVLEGEKSFLSTIKKFVLLAGVDERTGRTSITLYDLRKKFLSLQHVLSQAVTITSISKFNSDGVSFLFTSSNQVIRLREKSLDDKLEVFKKKGLYPEAISLAAEEKSDVPTLMGLYREYGDCLFKKGQFRESVDQYSHTIGYLQPSYVIYRFIDSQAPECLILYLERLHSQKKASPEHTTLLLSCYARERMEGALCEFLGIDFEEMEEEEEEKEKEESKIALKVKRLSSSPPVVLRDLEVGQKILWDVKSAISTLFDGGYKQYALAIAERHEKHDWYLRIRTSDIRGCGENIDEQRMLAADALGYLNHIYHTTENISIVEPLLLSYGEDILQAIPKEFTSFVILVCTGLDLTPHLNEEMSEIMSKILSDPPTITSRVASMNEKMQLPSPEIFFTMFVDHPRELRLVLEVVMKVEGHLKSIPLCHSLIDLTLLEWRDMKEKEGIVRKILQRKGTMSSNKGLRVEGVDLKEYYENLPESDLRNEENYLRGEMNNLRRRVYSLLDTPSVTYDPSHVLVLLKTYNFEDDASLKLIDQQKDPELLMDRHIALKNFPEILTLLHAYGPSNSHLYVKAIMHLVNEATLKKSVVSNQTRKSMEKEEENEDEEGGKEGDEESMGEDESEEESSDDEDEEELWDNLSEVLKLVERESSLPYLHVLSLLMSSPHIPLSVAKPFLKKEFRSNHEKAVDLERDIRGLNMSNDNLSRGLVTIHTTPRTLQQTDMGTGGSSRRPFDSPFIYFRCGHSMPSVSFVDPLIL